MSSESAHPTPDESLGRFGDASKSRMAELVAMAMAYRNWSQRELAEFLGRDVHNIIPGSGVPKVDLVVRLAEALDWPAAAVLEDICGQRQTAKRTEEPSADFRSLNRAAFDAFVAGRYTDAVAFATKASSLAATPDELAECDNRESAAWDGLGRFQNAIDAALRGLRRAGISGLLRADLRANLASCYLALGQVHEAEGVATSLLADFDLLQLDVVRRCGIRAHLLFVRAQCRAARIDIEPDVAAQLAAHAKADFVESAALWEEFAATSGIDGFRGRAHAARGGVVAAEAALGERSALEALALAAAELEHAIDLRSVPRGDRLEAYGWWCVFGAQIALRATTVDRRELDLYLAVFTNKAYEVAELSGNWSLRERAFTIDFLRARSDATSEVLFDSDDVRVLAGAMGRFPAFRSAGWELLRRACRI